MVQRRLIDAAEEVMRSGEPEKLTIGTVAVTTEIARSSIYRHIDSMDDLRGLVLARHLLAWIDAVVAELETVEAPTERIVVRIRANLQQAAHTGRGWLIGLSRSITPPPATVRVMDDSHAIIRDSIAQAWAALVQDPMQLRIAAGLTRSLLEVEFWQLDPGMPVDVMVDLSEKAAHGLVAGITSGDS